MACAKKCDRCGKLYEQYNSKNDRKNPNGIMVLNLDSQRRYFAHNALDLCPDCMKGFQDWFGEVKQMERLTERYDVAPNGESDVWVKQHDYISAARKLAEYEDLEEQGLLVRLPCKVGDMLWYNILGYTESYEIKAFSYGYCDGYIEAGEEIGDEIIFYCENHTGSIIGSFPMSGIGKIVFLTREEAEKKLEELKNEI